MQFLNSLTYILTLGVIVNLLTIFIDIVIKRRKLLLTIFEFSSIFSSIGYIKLFSDFINDAIKILSGYLSISKLIIKSLLLSVGNTLGDFFGNAALAKQGEFVMGILSCYAG